MTIRQGLPGDAGEIVELTDAVGGEAEGWILSEPGSRTVSGERRYLRAVRSHPDAVVFVAEAAGRIVGRIGVARDRHPASGHVADLGLMVAAAHRGRGIGRALLLAAVGWSRSVGITKLELHVLPGNEAAIGLYESFGFVREGYRRRHYRRPDGELLDAILMAYDLDQSDGGT